MDNAPLCPRCKERPREPRSTGGYRSWCKPCENSSKYDYNRSEAFKDSVRRYRATDKGKAARQKANANYRDSEKGKLAQARAYENEKRKRDS